MAKRRTNRSKKKEEEPKGISPQVINAIIAVVIVVIILVAALNLHLFDGSPSGGGSSTNPTINPTVNYGIEVGDYAPEFTLTEVGGAEFKLSNYRGNVVILDLMATWCVPCGQEMSYLNDIYYSYTGVTIISVDIESTDSNDALAQYKADHQANWAFALDKPNAVTAGGTGDNSLGITYQAYSIPSLYIIDQSGKIAYQNTGVTDSQTLGSKIQQLQSS